MFAAAALCLTGCGGSPGSSSPVTSAAPASSVHINPARIDRARGDLPAGYEVTDAGGRVAPFAQWGFGAGWTADPPQCGVLADPVAAPASSKGWSASGPGGIVYAAVVDAPTVALDPAVTAACATWTLTSGRTNGTVTLGPGPTIDGAATVAMAATTTTVVEGGTQTRSHADTVTAYLGGDVVLVSVVTDPGSGSPQLGADFAAALMVKTVAALRG